MERHQFKTTINAPREKVWEILWGDETYPQWTSAFSEGSQVQTDWKKGSKVLFLDGKGDGMVSVVADNIANEFMSFKHLGMLNNGKEDLETAKQKGWSGAIENYTLKTVNGQTELTIDQDVEADYKEYFLSTWPKALEKLKTLAENRAEENVVAGEQSRTSR
ncbi:MAG TPA: SRPBCC domain-containing protein [Chryseolinea sp.]|jgi:hypothetical protein|nr:SRPBCC domain-containing protein [Chryseolinea sp.]